jgi:hypothetical protein
VCVGKDITPQDAKEVCAMYGDFHPSVMPAALGTGKLQANAKSRKVAIREKKSCTLIS